MKASDLQVFESGELRVEFSRISDRWKHTIGIVSDGQFIPLLESDESPPDDDPSLTPALQELHLEGRGARIVAMLVGMSGESHWSLSAEFAPDHGRAFFDVACRRRGHNAILGSSYSAKANCVVSLNERSGIEVRNNALQPWLIVESPYPTGITGGYTVDTDQGSVSEASPGLMIGPGEPDGGASQTLRWHYTVTVLQR